MTVKYSGYFNKKGEPEGGLQKILEFLTTFNKKDVLVRMDYYKKNKTSWDEVDLFCKSLKISSLEIQQGERNEKIARFTFTETSEIDLIKLFANIGLIGNPGHCFEILIDNKEFCFDGDGADRVIEINGLPLRGENFKQHNWANFTYANTHKEEITLNESQLRECVKNIIIEILNG